MHGSFDVAVGKAPRHSRRAVVRIVAPLRGEGLDVNQANGIVLGMKISDGKERAMHCRWSMGMARREQGQASAEGKSALPYQTGRDS